MNNNSSHCKTQLLQNLFRLFAGLVFATSAQAIAAAPAHFDVRIQNQSTEILKLPRKHLYAAGLSENGRDVIVIANGNVYAARVDDSGKMTIDSSMKTKTSDLVYTNISRWVEVPLPPDVTDRERVHTFIVETLSKFGFENPGTVPFLLKGRFKKAKYIVPKPGGTVERSRANVDALLVGFFTKQTEATPAEGHKSVIHALFEKPQAVGRIESLTVEKGRVILYLPK